MPWERFVYTGRSFTPRATINTLGNLSFNAAARNKFGLDAYKFAVLHYDQDTGRIGVQLTNSAREEGKRTLRHRPTGADISIRPFLAYFDLVTEESRSFEITQEEKSGYLVLDLATGQKRRRRRRKAS